MDEQKIKNAYANVGVGLIIAAVVLVAIGAGVLIFGPIMPAWLDFVVGAVTLACLGAFAVAASKA